MKLALLVVAAVILTACQPAPDTRKMAIVGARLIDGKGGAPLEHSILLIEGATLIKVGAQTSVPLPKDVEIVDGMGKTIQPLSGTLEPGQPASLKLDQRTMKDGQWQN